MVYGDQFGAFVEKFLVCLEVEGAVVKKRDDSEGEVQSLAKHLPGNGVRVVLETGENNLVASGQPGRSAERGRDQVDGIGGAGGEDDFFRAVGIEVSGDSRASLLVGSSGSLGKSVDAAMNVGIDLFVVNPGGLEHCDRLLGGRRVVEIDEASLIS